MTDFEVGDWVEVANKESDFYGLRGEVIRGNYAQSVFVKLCDSYGFHRPIYFYPEHLESLEEPAKPGARECYVTAWLCDDGSFAFTGDTFLTKEDADSASMEEVEAGVGDAIAVFKMVSKHSSAVTVTSEDV